MEAYACYSLKRGKEASSCVPAFQVGMPKSGQATLYVISASALQSQCICEKTRWGGLTATAVVVVVVQRFKGGRVFAGRGGPWVMVVVAGFAVKPVQLQWY
jgi:hypothetical protein